MICSGQDHIKARGVGRNHPTVTSDAWACIVCSTAFLPQQKCSYVHCFGKETIIQISIHWTAPCWLSGRTFLPFPVGSRCRSGAQNVTWRLFSERMHEHSFSRCWERQVKEQQYRLFPPEGKKKCVPWPQVDQIHSSQARGSQTSPTTSLLFPNSVVVLPYTMHQGWCTNATQPRAVLVFLVPCITLRTFVSFSDFSFHNRHCNLCFGSLPNDYIISFIFICSQLFVLHSYFGCSSCHKLNSWTKSTNAARGSPLLCPAIIAFTPHALPAHASLPATVLLHFPPYISTARSRVAIWPGAAEPHESPFINLACTSEAAEGG